MVYVQTRIRHKESKNSVILKNKQIAISRQDNTKCV